MSTNETKWMRTTFETSREMDFFSEKELTTQTGHSIEEWPLVFLKEAIDNALDACDEADIAPVIRVTADAHGITVQDNGAGIPETTIESALDFRTRASNREAYVAPDRGAQGNALMTILAMPYVIDPDGGQLVISAHGTEHRISCAADPITQRPIVRNDRRKSTRTDSGTTVGIHWREARNDHDEETWPFGEYRPKSDDDWESVLRLLRGYALFNPHLTLSVTWLDEKLRFDATDTDWQKWKPDKPTSPHWYEPQNLERLVAACIAHDRKIGDDRTVAAFLSDFDGLTGNRKRKAVTDETGLGRAKLSELAGGDGLQSHVIANLLTAMKEHTRVVKAKRLGVIGKEHLSVRFEELGCDPEQFKYSKVMREDDGIPFVLESAFSWRGDDADDHRYIFAAANWSSAIHNPFRSFGSTGEGLEAQLTQLRAGRNEPIVFALHLAHPRVEYTDRGKSAIVVND